MHTRRFGRRTPDRSTGMQQLRILLLVGAALLALFAANVRAFDEDFDFRRHTCGSKSCYDVIGVKADASMPVIRRTYRDLSQQYHPDKFDKTKISAKDAKEKFQEIARAYEILSDTEARKQYDVLISDPNIWLKIKMLEKGNKTIKTNWFIVAPIVLGLIVFFEWYVTNTNYQQAVNQHRARKRAKTKAFSASSTTPPSSPRRKKMDKKASKSKLAQESGASAAEEEDFVIIGADGKRILPYSFKRSIIVETIRVPYDIAVDAKWAINWFIKYKVLKKPYDDAAKEYLTMSSLLLDADTWEHSMTAEEKADLISKQLWIDENLMAYAKSTKRSKSMPLPRSRMPLDAPDS